MRSLLGLNGSINFDCARLYSTVQRFHSTCSVVWGLRTTGKSSSANRLVLALATEIIVPHVAAGSPLAALILESRT